MYIMGNGPVIYLDGYTIDEISYNTVDDKESLVNRGVPEFSFEFGLTQDLKNAIVRMTVELQQENREIVVKMSGNFSIPDSDLPTEDIKMYVAQNGSAMLYPYLRSIVSVITTLDSPTAVVLPTLNMIEELSKQKNKDLSED